MLVALLAGLTMSCAPSYTLVTTAPDEDLKNETFQYRKWVREGVDPDTVVVALHGFSGASIDYENLATHLLKEQPSSAVYAYEVRGQGRDPKKERRGDIDDPENWSVDLLTFTSLVEKKHPNAKIVWFGESMGGLILSHTYREQIEQGLKPPCDAIGISSPVVAIRDDFPAWKKELVRGLSKVAPKKRISLETLAGGQEVQMTEDSFHSEQSETNSWHVERHTLRLLVTLGDMIEEMPECAESFAVPTLVLHGGKDFFTEADDVKTFVGHIPETTYSTRKFYPEGHHLLMYDTGKEKVISDIAGWLGELRK
ncbi:alpha/beta hydrolase [Haloferula helveola]|uniref:Alpha/beta hydrolase n=1 Tax=Haloferula helveola TaxID=490095 RepID=A0ABM7RGS0_9BACT|nr:alpha/beta hydrolase [Haloferula helveola]